MAQEGYSIPAATANMSPMCSAQIKAWLLPKALVKNGAVKPLFLLLY